MASSGTGLLRTGLRSLVMALALCTGAIAQSHFPDPVFHDGADGTAGPYNDGDAARFLAQATFGPTDADIAHLRAVGYHAWLNEQFSTAQTSEQAYIGWVESLGENISNANLREAWFLAAFGGPDPDPKKSSVLHSDQLRQRVAFALSEIFVVSDQNTFLDQHAEGLAYYYDILAANAFGNFRALLEQVTLSPQMGIYLNMLGNRRADMTQNLHPDENYAREINQLFSIGLVMLKDDGTPQLPAGKPVPTYDQSVITTFAHVFTGWNWADCTSGNFTGCGYSDADFTTQMAPFAAWHDDGLQPGNDIACKQLLSYPGAANSGTCGGVNALGVLSSGGDPVSDLHFALDNIFHHPNVGPFIGKQLIQRLVTSNPSPAYVQRITNVFNDDGLGVRGNLQAVVQAILLDPEARYGQFWQPTTFGKLREPLLRATHFWRAMGALHHCGQNAATGQYANSYRYAGYSSTYGVDDTVYSNGVAQAPLYADSVFNFFKPGFMPPGEMTTRGLLGPEFQINTDTIITNTTNNFFDKTKYLDLTDTCDPDDTLGDVAINRAHDVPLAGSANGGAADPADKLVNAYNVRFMSGQMSPFMRAQLLNALNPVSSTNYDFYGYPSWQFERIDKALLLIINSPEYMVQK